MAGNLKEQDVLLIPRCPNHNIPCVIKTGTKRNSTYGQSFYICNNSGERCSFADLARDVTATYCPVHNEMVELKAFAAKQDGIRCYYRCLPGKETGKGWCGNAAIKKQSVKLEDIPNVMEGNSEDLVGRKNIADDVVQNNIKTAYELYNKQNIDKGTKVGCWGKARETTQPYCSKANTTASDRNLNQDQNCLDTFSCKTNPHVFNMPKSAELNLSSNDIDTGDQNKTSNLLSNRASKKYLEQTQNKQMGHVSSTNIEQDKIEKVTETLSDTTEQSHDEVRTGALSKTIEIISSSDEENAASNSDITIPVNPHVYHIPRTASIEDEVKKKPESSASPIRNTHNHTVNLTNTKKQNYNVSNDNSSYFGRDMIHLQNLLTKKQEIYEKFGRSAPDGGARMYEQIQMLKGQLAQLKNQEVTASNHSLMKTINPPKIVGSAPVQAMVNLGYNYPPSLLNQTVAGNNMPGRHAPLFGGRMTETRLKEVGRITKGAIEQLHKSLDTCPSPTEEAEDPNGINVPLMTHQKQAMAWLLWRERQLPSGGILADDMGLGKTLTMISLVLKSKQEKENSSSVKELPEDSKLQLSEATVIVCPASLVHQWHKEIEKRVNKMKLKVCLYHGANREKRVKRLAGYDVVLTTYNIVSIEGKPHVNAEKDKPKVQLSEWCDASQRKEVVEGPLFKIFWRRIILDEGHSIKNHKAAMSIAVSALESESRWIVTGTPIQNQTMDLYSLIKFLRVSPFDELKVWKREVDNKSNSGTKRMNSIVNSILLRRTKDQIDQKTGKPLVSLPDRSSIVHRLKLSSDEHSVYELIQKFSKNMFREFMDTRKNVQRPDHPPCKSKDKNDYQFPSHILGMCIEEALAVFGLRGVSSTSMSCLLVLILRLRQCCGHLSLMCEPIDIDICKSEGIDVTLEETFGNLSIDKDSPLFQITAIIKILKDLEEKSRASGKTIKSVIVSQWTRMLDIISHHLKVNGFKYDFITGSVNAKKRADLVESFNCERYPQIMLVSLKAGGVGLNLVGGSHLFLIDQHWNPALEDQACDRIYRVGQENNVVIHRFLCEDTVEERIVQLQERKKSIANSVLYGGKTQKLTLDDLKSLFGITR